MPVIKMKFNKLLKESQFHGGRRLAERNFRWCWLIAMLMLFGSAVTVIYITVRRFLDNPTYMVQLETVEDSMEFPSVLVCPEVLFREEKIDQFLATLEIPPNLNLTYLRKVVVQLGAYYSPDIVYRTHDLRVIERLLELNDIDVETAARMLTTSCEDTLIRCRWQGVIVSCSSLFHMELTGDGYCCVFNGRSLSRESNDVYNNNNNTVYKKWYTEAFGFGSGLMLVVNQSQIPADVDLSYKWLALQTSQHYVESTINGTALSPGAEQWVEYHARNFQIEDDARSLSHTLRKCRMTYEPLKYFPVYYKKYCVVECEAANTLKRCDCVRLVHPRSQGTAYCNAHRLLCAKHAMVSYDSEDCNCPPACDVAMDSVKISSFGLLQSIQPIDTFYDGLDFENVTIVRAFVLTRKVNTNSRRSYFNSIDLFSQLGGVFNVFFGCSILTLLELIILAYHSIKPRLPAKRKTNAQSNQKLGKKQSKKSGKKQ